MKKYHQLWGRFGISMDVSLEEAEAIVNDRYGRGKDVLAKVFAEGRAMFNGESYIPYVIVKEFNLDNGTNLTEEDIDLNTRRLEDKPIRPVQRKPPDRGDAR